MSGYDYNVLTPPNPPSVAADQSPALASGYQEIKQYLQEVGRFKLNATSRAYEASHVVKTGGAIVYGFSGYNSGPAQWVQVLDATTLPANGFIPGPILAVASAASFAMDWGAEGRNFFTGAIIVCSTTGPTLTIGSANCWFDVQYV